MGKIINENGILWYVEEMISSGIKHTHKKYIGTEKKEEKKERKKKGKEK